MKQRYGSVRFHQPLLDKILDKNRGKALTETQNSCSEAKSRARNSTLLAAVLSLLALCPARAQVVGDTTLPIGERSQVTGNPNFQIDGGAQRGGNLFHSFSQFSVPTGGSAFFNNAAGVQNIISRVTGGSSSSIDGRIQTNGSANLFLINPNGIVFGPNASLQVGGSFLASTGSSLKFADGSEFSATTPQSAPLLTVSVPIGVQFGSTPQSILVSGSGLAVQSGKTLGLLGGDLTIEGGTLAATGGTNLAAPSGRIELGSVGSNSLVSLTSVTRGFAFGYGGVQTFQQIQILQEAYIDATPGGDIQVQGQQVQLSGGSQIVTTTTAQPGGTLTVNGTDAVELSGTDGGGTFNTGLFNRTSGAGIAGALTVNTKDLIVSDGALISASTSGAGQGGNLTINASNSVAVNGVSAANSTLFSGISVASNRNATGSAGNLVINTGNLSVTDGGQVSASTFGRGQGGNLTVNASTIQLTGGSNALVSGLFAQAGSSTGNNAKASGQGGNLMLNTGKLVVQDGSRVSTSTYGAGQAGNLVVNASQSVQVVGRSSSDQSPSILSAGSTSAGAAGNLAVTTPQLTVENGGKIAVSSTGTGVAGDLKIVSPFIQLDNQGVLTAATTAGQGNIVLNTSDLRLRHNSLISTNATGTATGGNITIDTATLVALENSDITANAQDSFGGRVSIQAQGIFGTAYRTHLTPESDITATSALGPQFSGSVTIQTPGIDPSQGLVQFQTNVVDLSQLVVEACSAKQQQAAGEFVITGRGGLPPSPTDAASDGGVLVDLGKPLGEASSEQGSQRPSLQAATPATNALDPSTPSSEQTQPPLVQAQGWMVNAAGKVVLVAQSTAPTLQGFWLTTPTLCNTH